MSAHPDDAPKTIEVAEKDRLDLARLTAWMEANVEGFEGPLDYTKFAGGQSNPTYKLEATSGEYVLRRKPFGNLLPSAHAVDREYRVIAGLYPTGFPVARPYGLCTDPEVIGTDFYIMDIAAAKAQIGHFVDAVAKTGRSTLTVMGEPTLSVVNPDQYRGQIADLIAADAATMKVKFGPDYGVNVSGLDRPVEWARAGPVDVVLYLPSTYTVTRK